MSETIQICPIADCQWMNPIVESDEPSVFAASMKTFEHLLDEHPTREWQMWQEVVLCRVPREDVMGRVQSR